jgi:hypothetical protein
LGIREEYRASSVLRDGRYEIVKSVLMPDNTRGEELEIVIVIPGGEYVLRWPPGRASSSSLDHSVPSPKRVTKTMQAAASPSI